jgi:hypothetical protein
MNRQYDPAKAGRQTYTAANGAEIERKYLYATPENWDAMQSLARTIGQPLGKMLVMLAYAEIDRIRKSQYAAPVLQHASHR